jgi:anti-sigma28 factor (negative regulator of flagellin synthesis)
MPSINGIGNNLPVQKIVTQPVQKQVPANPPVQVRLADRVELSGLNPLLATLKANNIRTELVTQIKQQIAAGNYDADGKKLDVAIARLLDDLQG